jgi:hypothetical protein
LVFISAGLFTGPPVNPWGFKLTKLLRSVHP